MHHTGKDNQTKRVLVVGGNAGSDEVRAMASMGYSFDIAESASDAEEKRFANHYDAILLLSSETWTAPVSPAQTNLLQEQALQESNRRLALLSDTASQLLITENPQGLVQSLCEKVLDILDCHAFFNFLVDEGRGCLHLNAFAGIPDEAGKSIEWLDYGVAVCGCAARDGCRIVAEDIFNTPDPRTDLVKSYGIQAYACHPLLAQGGRVIGTLSFGSRSKTSFTDDELALMKAVADQVATAMERIRLLNQERELESHKRDFYRRTILAATEGKLLISERNEIENASGTHIGSWQIDTLEEIGAMRNAVIELAGKAGMDQDQVHRFMGCIMEAAANAHKHACGGKASLSRTADGLVLAVSDSGPGIGAIALPDVALTKGYTTAGTLGMGYKVMIHFADRVYLATGPEGTVVGIEMKLQGSDAGITHLPISDFGVRCDRHTRDHQSPNISL